MRSILPGPMIGLVLFVVANLVAAADGGAEYCAWEMHDLAIADQTGV